MSKIKVYKDGQERDVKTSKLAGYLAAGWQESPVVNLTIAPAVEKDLVKDTTSSKPTVTATAAVKSAEANQAIIDKETDDGNDSW